MNKISPELKEELQEEETVMVSLFVYNHLHSAVSWNNRGHSLNQAQNHSAKKLFIRQLFYICKINKSKHISIKVVLSGRSKQIELFSQQLRRMQSKVTRTSGQRKQAVIKVLALISLSQKKTTDYNTLLQRKWTELPTRVWWQRPADHSWQIFNTRDHTCQHTCADKEIIILERPLGCSLFLNQPLL